MKKVERLTVLTERLSFYPGCVLLRQTLKFEGLKAKSTQTENECMLEESGGW